MFLNWKKYLYHSDRGYRPLVVGVRLALAVCSTVASLVIAWMVIGSSHLAAHASPPTIRETALPSSIPWGIAFDNAGNVWVAEPGCDAAPTCGPQTGSIAEYSRQSFSLEQNFTEPAGYSSPLFLAIDANGNVWFTEPATDAIGELIPNGGNPSWQQFAVPASNAMPYDLTFDWSGNLWFTEFNASSIGEFNPATQQFTETTTPTANSMPYGIIGPDPSTGSIWFTENNSSVARIGRFTPPLSGTLTTGAISEYLTVNPGSNTTPHLIAFDYQGDVWWTEGFNGRIGRLVINQAINGTSKGVTEFTVPPPSCAPNSGCGVHISGIGVDSSNTVWFDDSLSARIGSFVPGTNTFSMYTLPGGTGSGKHPHDGLAVDGNNNIWFTEEFASNLGEALQSNVPAPTPGLTASPGSSTPPAAPVNKTWYFGEGRVGNGFQEFITLDNPDPAQACAADIRYMYTPVGGTAQNKTITVTINPTTRVTQSVNNDLQFPATGPTAADVSTFVTIDASTPDCPGIVAERPMYFHFFNSTMRNFVESGSDVVGATHTASTFYFADVPTGGGYASFLTILNPGTTTASVTATYYASGRQINRQALQVAAGTRGTINPNGLGLPQHVAAIVSSNQPIVVERPSYFDNINGGSAGTVSGAATVVGAQALTNDWLFAEGSTHAGFQEQLVIANLDTPAGATANVSIKLEYSNSTTQVFNLAVSPESQVIWNVNQHASSGASVSAEIRSSGAKIVAEREMFFRYNVSSSTTAVGVTDVTGEPGPAVQAAYSFAEGYTGSGFNEWLTVQNPTGSPERLFLTLINGAGTVYTQWLLAGPQTRVTVNITTLAQHYLSTNSNISILLQSQDNAPFVAERPMYWNTGGSLPTQGGSDVIGYYGQ